MKRILTKGLNHNVSHWSELSLAQSWIQKAVTILDNEEKLPLPFVQQRFGAWMIFMSDHKEQLGSLVDSIPYLLKITRSYWSGLFHCYQVDNLHLEQLRQKRLQQRRFRRDPENYLLELETKLIQSILPL